MLFEHAARIEASSSSVSLSAIPILRNDRKRSPCVLAHAEIRIDGALVRVIPRVLSATAAKHAGFVAEAIDDALPMLITQPRGGS